MTIKITLPDGKEVMANVAEEDLKKLMLTKKTGYERVDYRDSYYYEGHDGHVCRTKESGDGLDKDAYDAANYYSDNIVAENNARADKLYRQLRRFAVEHRTEKLHWTVFSHNYYIYYDYNNRSLELDFVVVGRVHGGIYFDSRKTAQAAIAAFHDELIWYFTEYKDSL